MQTQSSKGLLECIDENLAGMVRLASAVAAFGEGKKSKLIITVNKCHCVWSEVVQLWLPKAENCLQK
jgi:hypothetical protein